MLENINTEGFYIITLLYGIIFLSVRITHNGIKEDSILGLFLKIFIKVGGLYVAIISALNLLRMWNLI
jgi:hypothetical protein